MREVSRIDRETEHEALIRDNERNGATKLFYHTITTTQSPRASLRDGCEKRRQRVATGQDRGRLKGARSSKRRANAQIELRAPCFVVLFSASLIIFEFQ